MRMMDNESRIEIYRRMRARCADHAQALGRTNLALRLLQRRAPTWPRDREELVRLRLNWPILHLFWNHVLQCHYRRSGVDVSAGLISDAFPYFVTIDAPRGSDPTRRSLSRVTTQSSRIDLEGCDGSTEEFRHVFQRVVEAADPLFGIDIAVSDAIGERFLPRAYVDAALQTNADVYLTVSQITTVLVCMGAVETAVRGVFVDAHPYGHVEKPTHPLRVLGAVPHASFTSDWYGLGSNPGYDAAAYVHRHTGALVVASASEIVPFDTWCAGSVDRGLGYLLRRL